MPFIDRFGKAPALEEALRDDISLRVCCSGDNGYYKFKRVIPRLAEMSVSFDFGDSLSASDKDERSPEEMRKISGHHPCTGMLCIAKPTTSTST